MKVISTVLWGAVVVSGIYVVLNASSSNSVIMALGQQGSQFFRTLQGR